MKATLLLGHDASHPSHLASRLGADLQTEVVTIDGSTDMVSLHGLVVRAMGRLDESADLVFVPVLFWLYKFWNMNAVGSCGDRCDTIRSVDGLHA